MESFHAVKCNLCEFKFAETINLNNQNSRHIKKPTELEWEGFNALKCNPCENKFAETINLNLNNHKSRKHLEKTGRIGTGFNAHEMEEG